MPYTPEQNGIIDRFFRSVEEECVWQHNFGSFAEATTAVARWIDWYNESRPHPLSLREYLARKTQSAA